VVTVDCGREQFVMLGKCVIVWVERGDDMKCFIKCNSSSSGISIGNDVNCPVHKCKMEVTNILLTEDDHDEFIQHYKYGQYVRTREFNSFTNVRVITFTCEHGCTFTTIVKNSDTYLTRV
jgi:hypothetical protein